MIMCCEGDRGGGGGSENDDLENMYFMNGPLPIYHNLPIYNNLPLAIFSITSIIRSASAPPSSPPTCFQHIIPAYSIGHNFGHPTAQRHRRLGQVSW